jgi:PIN domain nuclease of toxin-antitoxin system
VRLLLDTHALLWWLAGDQALSDAARQAITDPDNEVFVSAASAWEIATKYRLGRLPGAAVIAGAVASQGFTELPTGIRDGQAAGGLPASTKIPSIGCRLPRRSSRTW